MKSASGDNFGNRMNTDMDADMHLAPNFTLREMARTEHRDLAEENLRHAYEYLSSLRLTAAMLQVVRDHFDRPVVVHSGFRCPALNTAVGGSSSSQHLRGEAADFHVVGFDLVQVWTWIWKKSDIPFGQLILEGVVAGEPSWVHLSLGEPLRLRSKSRQVFTWDAANGYYRVA